MTRKEKKEMTRLTWEMFKNAAREAGISTPEKDVRQYVADQFPYWHVFICEIIRHPMPYADLLANAKIIAGIPKNEIFAAGTEYCAARGVYHPAY